MNQWTLTIPIDSPWIGQRADRALTEAWIAYPLAKFTPPSRSQLQNWCEQGRVTSEGVPIKSNHLLRAGETIVIALPPPKAMTLTPEDRPLDILFQDAHLVVINKPPGLTVHPSETQTEGTLVHALLHHIRDLSGIGGVLRPGIVHRLDKDTSGALVVTKTDEAHRRLAEVFAKHDLERRYWALCYGEAKKIPTTRPLRIDTLLGRHPNDRKRMSSDVTEGRRAVTDVTLLENYGNFACLLEATLHTGRTHQVRVHLTGQGHSLLGDPVYGKPSDRHTKWTALPPSIRRRVEALPGQALHARVLGFNHPITGEPLRFEAAPPPAFADLLLHLRETLTQDSR